MNKHLVALISVGALFSIGAAGAESPADLKGDAKAVERIGLMIDRLGGAEIWSEAESLYLEYEGWNASPAQAVVEHAWRDFREPNERIVFEGRRSDTTFHMTREESWLTFSERMPRVFSAEEHDANLDFWNFDFYTILHNLARGDERITLRFEEPRTVRIEGPRKADWGWFEIDDTGQPVRWGASYNGDPLEYIYGPVTAYGNINFPAWGTASDGSWRFQYRVVDISRSPIDVDLTPPELAEGQ